MIGEMVKLELTPVDAELFREFRRVQDTLSILSSAGVFNVKNGRAILNFDAQGVLTQVDFDYIRWKRGMPMV